MITQKQIKAWIPSTVAQFTAVMPPCEAPLPEIVVASEAQIPYVREELIEKKNLSVSKMRIERCQEDADEGI